jgi:hypothetical protein
MSPATPLPVSVNARTASATQAEEELPPSGDLVTVARLYNSLEAEMLRGCLQAEGIPATLGDAQTIQTDTLLTQALGGIRLMVPTSCEQAARATVAAFERGDLTIDELPADDIGAAADADSTSQTGMPRLTLLVILVLAAVGVVVALGRPGSPLH